MCGMRRYRSRSTSSSLRSGAAEETGKRPEAVSARIRLRSAATAAICCRACRARSTDRALETYYHGLYAGAVSVIEILEDCGRTEELAALCRQAVKIEPYKEFYEHLMGALIENGDNREAMAVYDDASEMLFSGSASCRERPCASCTGRHRARSATILCRWTSMQLQENGAGGAMLCEYDFFKILYRMQARAGRTHGHRRAYLSAVGDGERRFRPCAPQSGRRDGKAAAAAARQSAARRRYLVAACRSLSLCCRRRITKTAAWSRNG